MQFSNTSFFRFVGLIFKTEKKSALKNGTMQKTSTIQGARGTMDKIDIFSTKKRKQLKGVVDQ